MHESRAWIVPLSVICGATLGVAESVYGTAWSSDGQRVAMLVLNKTLRMLEAAPAGGR
jgi:hypothetical protein